MLSSADLPGGFRDNSSLPPPPWWLDLLFSVAVLSFAGVPVAIGFAVLKYRLYDIDIIINRTLVYGSLTATLVAIYFGGVATMQTLFRALTGQEQQPQLAVVVSTLAIAALFNPLRQRIQSFIDRRFYRRKYDARKTMEEFSARLRDETDLETLNRDLAGVIEETLQPAQVSLWLRPDGNPQYPSIVAGKHRNRAIARMMRDGCRRSPAPEQYRKVAGLPRGAGRPNRVFLSTGRTREAPGTNLPAARSSFVGREREMAEIERSLASTRLLTLTGAGGSGKTRLALEVARDLVGAYPDGVWLVELAPLSEGRSYPRRWPRPSGCPNGPPSRPPARWRRS